MPVNKYLHSYSPRLKPIHDEYWDFILSRLTYDDNNQWDKCLISFLDAKDDECIIEGKNFFSKPKYFWGNSINKGVLLKNIGYTGIDNGFIHYRRDRITNKEFLDLLTKSELKIDEGDYRLRLNPVTGNTLTYTYPYEFIDTVEEKYLKLRGGFQQGFFKLFNHEYQVLPDFIKTDWHWEFKIRPMDYVEQGLILNTTHKENKDIFFYIGTRAENKFWELYNFGENDFDLNCRVTYDLEGYFDDVLLSGMDIKNQPYFIKGEYRNPCIEYFADDYIIREKPKCGNGDYLDEWEYYLEDVVIEPQKIKIDGFFKPEVDGYYKIVSDNKHLLFNRTSTGFTTQTYVQGTYGEFIGIKRKNVPNYFIIFNRTKTGYTTNTIENYYKEQKTNSYDVYADLYENAFALKIGEDNSIGYRYLVKDCETDVKYKILEDYSYPNTIQRGEWNNINVRVKLLGNNECKSGVGNKKMKLYFYVGGKLVFISDELPEFRFRELNDVAEKQEGVAYNVSLGGGTQGLCEKIWLDYAELPKYILPLEKHFAGTFIGDIEYFKFHDCPLTLNEIRASL